MKQTMQRYRRALRLLAAGAAVLFWACDRAPADETVRPPAGEIPTARGAEAADGPGSEGDGAIPPATDTTGRPAPEAEPGTGTAAPTNTPPTARAPSPPGTRRSAEPVPTEAPLAAAEQVPEILRATSRAYEGLASFRAEFEQELHNPLLGRTTRSRGTIYQRRPDRFLMRFSEPAGDLVVSDGDHFWVYYPSVDPKQVLRTPRGGQGLDLQAQFIGDPVRRFETTSHGTAEVRGRTAYVLTLDPREPAGYERMKVWIDARDYLVRRFELTESNGNVRRLELHDLERNPTLGDDLFEFTPPPGAQVVTRG